MVAKYPGIICGQNFVAKCLVTVTWCISLSSSNAYGTTEGVELSAIVYSGNLAPGNAGAQFTQFNAPIVNANGLVAFSASISDRDTREDSGVWTYDGSEVTKVVIAGDTAPGTSGDQFSYASIKAVSDEGHLLFSGRLQSDPTAIEAGLWRADPNGIENVALIGDPAPGINGDVVFRSRFENELMNSSGTVAFSGFFEGEGFDEAARASGIWVGEPGAMQLVAGTGTPSELGSFLPFATPGRTYLALNDNNQVAFTARVGGEPNGGFSYTSTWVGDHTDLSLVSWSESPTVSLEEFGRLRSVSPVSFNNNNEIAFFARTRSGSRDPIAGFGTAGSLETLHVEGETPPYLNLIPGITTTTFDGKPLVSVGSGANTILTAADEIIFFLTLDAGSQDSREDYRQSLLIRGRPEAPQVVMQFGTQAPDLPEGVRFSENYGDLRGLEANEAGEIAFRIRLAGDDVTLDNDYAIFFVDQAAHMHLVAREGDEITFDDGTTRIIEGFANNTQTGGADGRPSSIASADGRYFFTALFTDGSFAIVQASITAIPEPASLVLVMLCGMTMLSRRATS